MEKLIVEDQVIKGVQANGQEFKAVKMIFTHFGLSGPIILTLSRIVVDALHQKSKVEVSD